MKLRALLLGTVVVLPVASASASTLRGSHASMVRQHEVARKNDFTFLRTPKQVKEFAEEERLEEVAATESYRTDGVSFPYTRPVVKTFIERIAQQYHDATGSVLVITSLTRPTSEQPRNASPLSVHPAGMAVDFRVPVDADARLWLEQTLLSLEDRGLLDVTREHHPSHYHVAVFPDAYAAYAARTPYVIRPPAVHMASVADVAASAAAAMSAASDADAPTSLALSVLVSLAGLFGLAGFRVRRAIVLARTSR